METKTCTKCNKPKDIEQFSFKNKAKGKRLTWCQSCHKEYKDLHYRKNRRLYIRKAHNSRASYRAETHTKLAAYYKENPCVDCGEDDFVVCQSDHVKDKKTDNISRLVGRQFSWDKIEKELRKCVTRCANCHMRKTAKQFGWYKDMASSSNG